MFLCVAGNVGPPLPCSQIKLDSVPDMNYNSQDDKGEVGVVWFYAWQYSSYIVMRPSHRVKLDSVCDINYHSQDDKGEVGVVFYVPKYSSYI